MADKLSNTLSDHIATLQNQRVQYGTYTTDGFGKITLSTSDYIVLSASKENVVLIPYRSPSATFWFIRTLANVAFANESDVLVAYIKIT